MRRTPDCFYEGQDPLARIAALPGLLAVEFEPVSPWPPLDALDPFACNVVLAALTTSPRAEVAAAMGGVLSHCDIQELVDAGRSDGERLMPPAAREVLEAQVLLLGETASAGRGGPRGVGGPSRGERTAQLGPGCRCATASRAPWKLRSPRTIRELLREAIEALLGAAPSAVVAAAPRRRSISRARHGRCASMPLASTRS